MADCTNSSIASSIFCFSASLDSTGFLVDSGILIELAHPKKNRVIKKKIIVYSKNLSQIVKSFSTLRTIAFCSWSGGREIKAFETTL